MAFFRTVDNGIKLSSLLSIPDVSDVHTMNKITSDELNRLVTHEDAPEASQPLGHLLSHIFKSFKIPLPGASALQIPLRKIIYPNERVRSQYHGSSPDTMVPLYDTETSTWNWNLPVNPPGDTDSDSENAGSTSGAPVSPDTEAAGNATHEEIFASFLNALAGCLLASQTLLERECYATRTWSAASAHTALPGSTIKRKPDLVLSDDITAKWGNIRVSGELTHSPYKPAMRLGKAADTHAYLMMSEQPWRRFSLILSFTDAYRHLRVLMYDHSGGAVSTRFDIYQQPDLFSHIIAVINFGNLECVGYDSTVSFTKHVSPPFSKDIRAYRPMKNMPARRSSSADPAASTSESLEQVPTPESPSPDDDLESVASDGSGSEESLIEDSLEGSSNDSTTQSFAHEESAPSPFPVQPTMVSSAPLVSLASQIPQELTESVYSVTPHPSQFPHSAHSPEPCGKIRVGDTIYIIKRILFAARGLVGRGTTCYLVSLDEEDYIVKDHWVLGKLDAVVLNEIEMLNSMRGVPGVPDLVEYWLVTTSDGKADNTQNYRKKERKSTRGTNRAHVRLVFKPCARPLHMFRTLKELVRALRDIVIIQKTAVEERKILHRDCSLNNAMILDDLDISKGFLIDWEFAVRITADNQYPIGGTGTVPFMSRKLLGQVALIQEQATAEAQEKQRSKKLKSKSKTTPATKTPKTSSDSLALPISRVIQSYSDDLESLFFIFAWVCIKFSGPNGMVRQEHNSSSLLDRWTSLDLGSCAAFKVSFFANPLDEERLINEFQPYFKLLIPLATDWCAALRDNMVHPVTFDAILSVLNSHLDKLPDDEELQSTVTMLRKSATALNDSPNLKRVASLSLPVGSPKRKKSDEFSVSDQQM
ncbi:hypothetical protein BDR07DRAFT_1489173 [Suillus spraguei]|nr:hypothetical protein BDR07DRAFT_1489173 [Suillus spraguei]